MHPNPANVQKVGRHVEPLEPLLVQGDSGRTEFGFPLRVLNKNRALRLHEIPNRFRLCARFFIGGSSWARVAAGLNRYRQFWCSDGEAQVLTRPNQIGWAV